MNTNTHTSECFHPQPLSNRILPLPASPVQVLLLDNLPNATETPSNYGSMQSESDSVIST